MSPTSKPKLHAVESKQPKLLRLADVKPKDPQSLLEWKWKKAKDYYERAYNVKFTKRPGSDQVDFLYKQIFKLSNDISSHLLNNPDFKIKTI